MRRLALLGVPFALAGCAKFPAHAAVQDTRLHFTITFASPIDARYIYAVAIRRITDHADVSDTFGPIPVINTGSKNGIVEGRPTQLVQYDRASSQFFTVSTFATRTPSESDPNPIELAAPVLTSEAILSVDPQAGVSGSLQERQLEFEISTRDLAANADGTSIDPTKITDIQFNILTMNKPALTSVGDRVMDALGPRPDAGTIGPNTYRTISILTGGHHTNLGSSVVERADDVFNGTLPPIDIADWTVDVRLP